MDGMARDYQADYFDEKFKNVNSSLKRMDSKVDSTLKRMEKKVDSNLSETKNINSRVDKLEGEVYGSGGKRSRVDKIERELFDHNIKETKDLPKWYKDPTLMNFLRLLLIAIIIIMGGIILLRTGVNIFEALL